MYLSWSCLRHSLALLLLHRPTFSYRDLLRNLFFNNIAFGNIYFLTNIFGNWFCDRWTLLFGNLFANIPVHIYGYFLFNLNAFLTWNCDAFWNLLANLSFLAVRRILNGTKKNLEQESTYDPTNIINCHFGNRVRNANGPIFIT